MSEELYNSNDFCKLAEEFEELKKENAELSKDKDRLMNLFMESSEYVFDTSANMEIESLTQKCKALEADYEVSNREMLIIQVEIGGLKSELARRDEQTTKHLEWMAEQGNIITGLRDELTCRDEERADLLTKNKELHGYYAEQVNKRVCLEGELRHRDEIIKRLKEDGERLASTYVIEVFPHEWVCRGGCHHWARFGEQIDHTPDCPITLHRALMKELE